MGGGDGRPEGPDLVQGIAEEELAEGAMLAGRFGDDAVLVVRRDGEVYAVAGSCTHYGGPLAEGLLVDGTVRCPWHHACFDVRTGEALRAPALNDLACYTVARHAGRIVVGGKVERDRRAASRRPARSPSSVVIVGGGAAGNAAAETLRREGYAGPVTMVDREPDSPYDRPNLSKDYLAGTAPEEWIPLHPPSFYEEQRIAVVRATAESIDRQARRLRLSNGALLDYGALVLATGAEPLRLDVPTSSQAKVHTLRSLADSRALIETAREARRAVIIGSSFIGLEVAASLRHREVEVHVVGRERVPLEKVMGADLGHYIRELHESHGVVFHLGRTSSSIERDTVILDDGTRLDADFVVVGIGVRPRTELAEAAGLRVDGGVVVDERLATSGDGIWAAGDIARWPDPTTGERIRVEHWVLAERHGQAAARAVLGVLDRFEDVPFFWSQHYDVSISYVGVGAGWDVAKLDGDPRQRDCAVTFERAGRRVAVATIFRDGESLEAEVAMERAAADRAIPGAAP